MLQLGWHTRAATMPMLAMSLMLLAEGCNRTTTNSASGPEMNSSASSDEGLTGSAQEIAEKLLDNWSQEDGAIALRRVVSTRPLAAFAREATFSGDGKRIAARLRDGQVVVIDAKSGRAIWTKKFELEDASAGDLVAISRDGRFVAVNLYGRKVEVWDATSNQLVVERAERNPIHFVGLNRSGDSFFICEAAPPPGNTGDPNYRPNTEIDVSAPVEISFADGEATTLEANGFEQGVVAITPIMGGKGYMVLDAYSQLRYWNPEHPGTSKQLTKRTVFAKAGECLIRANQRVFMAHVDGLVMIGPMAALGLDPEPSATQGSEITDASDEEEPPLPTLVDLGRRMGDTSSRSTRIWGGMDAVSGRCFTSTAELAACDPDFPSFVVFAKRGDDRFSRSLDLSADCKFVVSADKDYSHSTLTIFELASVPEHPAMRIHKWAQKMLAEEKHDLIDAVLAAASQRTTRPKWAYSFLDAHDRQKTIMQQIVEGMLENRWVSQRVANDVETVNRWKEKHNIVTSMDPKALAKEAIELSSQNVDFQDNAPAKQLVDFVLNNPKADAPAVVAFVEMSPSIPTGRKVWIDVAARAAELCEPNDEVLVEIANGLHEYAYEAPTDPVIESTVGLIEAVANAEERKKGAVAGDAAYAALTSAIVNASSFKYITGKKRFRAEGDNYDSRFSNLQVERRKLARHYLDYERLVRGLTAHLSAHSGDMHAAKLALDLGYESNDKNLARLAIPFFENVPQMMLPPPQGYGNIKPYLDWAKSP